MLTISTAGNFQICGHQTALTPAGWTTRSVELRLTDTHSPHSVAKLLPFGPRFYQSLGLMEHKSAPHTGKHS